MRRADRLFRVVNFLKSRRRAVTAGRIAREFEVCERTIYRDIKDLMDSGMPIYGEAGVGYILDPSYSLPPLTFDAEEIEALVLGLAMVQSWTDDDFSKAARRTLDKIKTTLPPDLHDRWEETALFSPPSCVKEPIEVHFSDIRRAIRRKLKIRFHYTTLDDKPSERTIRPLAMVFFGPTWLLAGWCELRNDFRNFRLDRMRQCEILTEGFEDKPGKTLKDFLDQMGCEKME